MNFFDAVLVIIAPLIPLLIPGVFFIRTAVWENTLLSGSRILLWSMGSMTLLLTLGLWLGISVQTVGLLIAVAGIVYAIVQREQFFTRKSLWHVLAVIIPILFVSALFIVPFLRIHDGLPTGDVQKTIIWATESLQTSHLPDYERAIPLLNRDPVDFYTPGLHAVSALVLGLSPLPLTSIGIFSIMIAVCVAWITASITKELFDTHVHSVPPFLAALFTLTQYRFLRYLREPGYHFQNVVGELFLFGIVLLCIRFVRRGEKQDAFLCMVLMAALFLSHQFSAFIAVGVITAMGVMTLILVRQKIAKAFTSHRELWVVLVGGALLAIGLLFTLGLQRKIPALFTSTPHLTSFLPGFTDYPPTMGEFWFFAGAIGLVLMIVEAKRNDAHYRQSMLFGAMTGTILLLSQGPALGIDIPPVRALFYLVVPFSVAAAYLFGKLLYVIRYTYSGYTKQLAKVAVAAAILIAVSASTDKAYASLSHTVRTSSTLLGEQLGLAELLKGEKKGILIDDYNRRSASWLVLSGAPMVTSIAADLERQMEESTQSKLRMDLYLRQLDYEKIIELGSMPQIASLFSKNALGYVTGIAKTSDSGFTHNPLLHVAGSAGDITLYKVAEHAKPCTTSECTFILRSATLANDIGDELDTFEHLQASIRTTRLSSPAVRENTTYRTTNASVIPLSFNIGDYVRVLWNPNALKKPETNLTFMVWFTQPMEGLTLRTSLGKEFVIPPRQHASVELPSSAVEINEKGFISLSITNPYHQEVPIDFIALGPSLTP